MKLFYVFLMFVLSINASAQNLTQDSFTGYEVLEDLSDVPEATFYIFDSEEEALAFKALHAEGTWVVDEEGNEYFVPDIASDDGDDVLDVIGKSGRNCNVRNGGASWYGPGFHGKTTANGETFNQNALTAAHKTLKFGSIVRVTYKGKSVDVRINDAGPYHGGRVIDLSKAAATKIGLIAPGHGPVTLTLIRCGNG